MAAAILQSSTTKCVRHVVSFVGRRLLHGGSAPGSRSAKSLAQVDPLVKKPERVALKETLVENAGSSMKGQKRKNVSPYRRRFAKPATLGAITLGFYASGYVIGYYYKNKDMQGVKN